MYTTTNYSRSAAIFVWLESCPEEPGHWDIDRVACTNPADTSWVSYGWDDMVAYFPEAIKEDDPNKPDKFNCVLIKGYMFHERIDSVVYGTDYDGGFEIEEIWFMYDGAMEVDQGTPLNES